MQYLALSEWKLDNDIDGIIMGDIILRYDTEYLNLIESQSTSERCEKKILELDTKILGEDFFI